MSILLKWLIRALIGLCLVASVMAIVSYNLASRSLPNYNQSLVSNKITDEVEIVRDSSNIPHIFSNNINDVFFGLGYAHAQDRFWQLNILRRSAQGRLSEIFGQKTLQQDRSALDRVNVRRMLLEVKRIISDLANKFIFEQNTPALRAKFVAQATPKLAIIQAQQGIDQFKIVMDSSNNTQDDIENNRLNGKIILVPTRAVEFIAIDFIITNSGVSFE